MTHDFAFSGLIYCGKRGCSVAGELKKQRFVYYHCTGYAAPDSRFLRILEHVRDICITAWNGTFGQSPVVLMRSKAESGGSRRLVEACYQVADREDRSVQQVQAVAHERPWSPESLRGVL